MLKGQTRIFIEHLVLYYSSLIVVAFTLCLRRSFMRFVSARLMGPSRRTAARGQETAHGGLRELKGRQEPVEKRRTLDCQSNIRGYPLLRYNALADLNDSQK